MKHACRTIALYTILISINVMCTGEIPPALADVQQLAQVSTFLHSMHLNKNPEEVIKSIQNLPYSKIKKAISIGTTLMEILTENIPLILDNLSDDKKSELMQTLTQLLWKHDASYKTYAQAFQSEEGKAVLEAKLTECEPQELQKIKSILQLGQNALISFGVSIPQEQMVYLETLNTFIDKAINVK